MPNMLMSEYVSKVNQKDVFYVINLGLKYSLTVFVESLSSLHYLIIDLFFHY